MNHTHRKRCVLEVEAYPRPNSVESVECDTSRVSFDTRVIKQWSPKFESVWEDYIVRVNHTHRKRCVNVVVAYPLQRRWMVHRTNPPECKCITVGSDSDDSA